MKKQSCVRWKWIIAVVLVSLVGSTGYGQDKPWSRALRGELYPSFQMLSGDTVTAWDGANRVELDEAPTFGAGLGFNFNDHLNLNTEVLFGSMDSTQGSIVTPASHGHQTVGAFLWNVNLDYNILKSRLTPLITGGAGLFRVHEGEAHICESHAAGNLGAGVRWDMTDSVALRVVYRWIWVQEFAHADDPFEFEGLSASLIFMFK